MPVDTPTLSPSPSLACSLEHNNIGDHVAIVLAAVLKETKLTYLKCALALNRLQIVFANVSTPADTDPPYLSLGSVDGHALHIDELMGTKPTEKIDLSAKGLGVASAIIIASCIKENRVLKELKCAAARVFAFL